MSIALIKKCYNEHFDTLIDIAAIVHAMPPSPLKVNLAIQCSKMSKQLLANGKLLAEELS